MSEEKLGRFYSSGDGLHLYDSFDPQHRIARSAHEYAGFWEPRFNTLRSARRSSLVWPCEVGEWRIVREQNAVREVPGQVEAALGRR